MTEPESTQRLGSSAETIETFTHRTKNSPSFAVPLRSGLNSEELILGSLGRCHVRRRDLAFSDSAATQDQRMITRRAA